MSIYAIGGCEGSSVSATPSRSWTLRTVLDFLRPGDVLMVTRIDRLARSIGERAAPA
jgi:DNA invertase Pin-like site-specific DNA recombinase